MKKIYTRIAIGFLIAGIMLIGTVIFAGESSHHSINMSNHNNRTSRCSENNRRVGREYRRDRENSRRGAECRINLFHR